MFHWLKRYRRQPTYDQSEVDTTLDAFTSPRTALEQILVLKGRRRILISDTALETLRQRITHDRKLSNDQNPDVARLEGRLRLLEETRKRGLSRALYPYLQQSFQANPGCALRLWIAIIVHHETLFLNIISYGSSEYLLECARLVIDTMSRDGASKLIPEDRSTQLQIAVQVFSWKKEIATLEGDDDIDARTRRIVNLEDALERIKRTGNPVHQALLQNALARSLHSRKHAEDLERAVDLYKASLQVFSQHRSPFNWAEVQLALGSVYEDLAGVSSDEGQKREDAIACYKRTLQVFTRKKHPQAWANVQTQLGIIYFHQTRGDPMENQEHAITHFRRALEVLKVASPLRSAMMALIFNSQSTWNASIASMRTGPARARVQDYLGSVYLDRILGNEAENLRSAITCFDDALKFFTRDMIIRHHDIHSKRALAMERLGRWKGAHESLLAARDALRGLRAGTKCINAKKSFTP